MQAFDEWPFKPKVRFSSPIARFDFQACLRSTKKNFILDSIPFLSYAVQELILIL